MDIDMQILTLSRLSGGCTEAVVDVEVVAKPGHDWTKPH